MPHIETGNQIPGIRGLLTFRPETAGPMLELAEALLVRPSSLSRVERELIATYVSSLNNCEYCRRSHGAAATSLAGGDRSLVEMVIKDYTRAPVSAKLKALLAIAAQVQKAAAGVTPELILAAKAQGATDIEVHDAVLVAAAFCMYNKYVDGLAAITPQDDAVYAQIGERLHHQGYGTK